MLAVPKRRLTLVLSLAMLAGLAATATAGGLGSPQLNAEYSAQRARADAVLATMARPYASQLERAVAIAKTGTAAQAQVLGLPSLPAAPTVVHQTPSQALLALLARHGQSPGATQLSSIRQFDRLAAPARTALTRFVDAFIAFEAATRSATQAADAGKLAALRRIATSSDPAAAWRATAAPGDTPWRALVDAGVALGPILAARSALADASLGLQAAFAAPAVGAPSVNLCPVFAINLTVSANWYGKDCALILDAGGNDVYRNNAGGTAGAPVAALVDLAGSDRYGNPLAPRSHGVNGGASSAFIPMAGFLLDAGGSDQYVGSFYGVNGGGSAGGLGHLVDAGGIDRYTGSGGGVNGAGNLFGAGLLVDTGGADVFYGGGGGGNGGGFLGTGMLLAADGNDLYTRGAGGANGGAFLGQGLLVDRGGNDTYRASYAGVNGGADAGVGLLLDQGGTDSYADQDRTVDGLFRCSGSGWNRTVVPKCVVGGQIDAP